MPGPRFSILTPVYRPPRKTLQAMLESVRLQTFADWEHCLVDDRSEDPEGRAILDQAAADDPRIRVQYRDRNGGIVAATNDAIHLARGEFVAFLDHDDELHPRALETMAAAIAEHPDADYLYSDEDKIDERNKHFHAFVKPDFSPDRLRSQMFMTHFRVVRRSLVGQLGGLRTGFDGSQDWDLALRVSDRTDRIVHVPGIRYHWRALPGSAATDIEAKPWAYEAGRRAVSESVERSGIQATAEEIPGYPGHLWLRPALREHPLVSIVIPTAGRARDVDGDSEPLVLRCVRSIVDRSTYEDYELVVVLDARAPDSLGDRLRELAGERLNLVSFEGPFNFSAKVNLGVKESSGEQILLLNDDVEVPPPGWRPVKNPIELPSWDAMEVDGRRIWIEAMLAYALQAGVGAVGSKLYFPDGRLQHAGIICREGRPAHPFYLGPSDTAGYAGNLVITCNYLAVTAACMMTPRTAFEAVEGFDEELPRNFNDVDYCLKLNRAGLRAAFLPHVELVHRESASRGHEPPATPEVKYLRRRWGPLLDEDPYYGKPFLNDHFTLPPLGRGGEFRKRTHPLSYVDRLRRTYRGGGGRLVAQRLTGKLRYEVRTRFSRAARRPR